MPSRRTLRGGCQCGRNRYIIQPSPDATEVARLLFDPTPSHRTSLASPLPAYLRVPLAWYHSETLPRFSDETQSMIHRSYEHLISRAALGSGTTNSSGTRRQFCGFCGTPLSFWSETPQPEADYIRLTLGSLNPYDLDELDEWTGVVDESEEEEDGDVGDDDDTVEEGDEKDTVGENQTAQSLGRTTLGNGPIERITSTTGIPWLDSYVEGSRLARHLLRQQKLMLKQRQRSAGVGGARVLRHDAVSAQSADGSVRVEFEVQEWTEGDDQEEESVGNRDAEAVGTRSSEPSPAKRVRLDEADSRAGVGSMDVE
ncbi:hypothetical protein SEPCBS57363_003550 [Sporothrix epigloea]|uniref:CENP-V/GFA domain-containing protein n=1 Tax=Sporothrix epigloea TaxID=1892477 RepID=A0ABP0DP13_9PEZI